MVRIMLLILLIYMFVSVSLYHYIFPVYGSCVMNSYIVKMGCIVTSSELLILDCNNKLVNHNCQTRFLLVHWPTINKNQTPHPPVVDTDILLINSFVSVSLYHYLFPPYERPQLTNSLSIYIHIH